MLGRSQHCRDHRYEQRVEGVIAIRGDRQDLAYSETEWRARCGRFFDDNRDNINCVPDDWDDPNFYRSLPAARCPLTPRGCFDGSATTRRRAVRRRKRCSTSRLKY